MPGTDQHGAQASERLLAELEAGEQPGAGFVTVSAGVAAAPPRRHDRPAPRLRRPRPRPRPVAWAAPAPPRRSRRASRTPTRRTRRVVEALASALLERDRYTGEHSTSVVEMARTGRHPRAGRPRGRARGHGRPAARHRQGRDPRPDPAQARGAGPAEWDLCASTPSIGERILRAIPGMGAVARIVRHEHEHFDGAGYPDGLRARRSRSARGSSSPATPTAR